MQVTCGVISRGTRYPQAAWKLLNFLTTQWNAMFAESFWAPVRPSVAESDAVWDFFPGGILPTLRFGLDHAWYGSSYPAQVAEIHQGMAQAIARGTDWSTEFKNSNITEPTDASQSPVGQEPLTVATPIPTTNPENVRVVEYGGFESFSTVRTWEALAEEFHQLHPEIEIRLRNHSFADMPTFENLTDRYDCFLLANDYATWEEVETAYVLDPLLDAEDSSLRADFIPGVLESVSLNGRLYGFPALIQPPLMAYHADLLAQYGLLPPTNDWTFDEMMRMATTVASEAEQRYGLLFYLGSDGSSWLIDGQNVHRVDWDADPPLAYFDQPDVMTAYHRVKAWLDAGVLLRGQRIDQDFQRIQNGQVAFWVSAGGLAGNGYNADTGFQDIFSFKVGLAPMPQPQSEYWKSGVYSHFISPRSKNPQACWNWIVFVSQHAEVFPAGVPARRSVAESQAWKSRVGAEMADVYLAAAAQSVFMQPMAAWNPVRYLVDYWESLAWDAMLAGGDPQPILLQAQYKADIYLKCLSAAGVFAVPSALSEPGRNSAVAACAHEADPENNP
jgi:ABC-type glycerol-3-phosphate transport system substrate-binding protein